MPNAQEGGWPKFELFTFSDRNGVPLDWAYPLMTRGVPKRILGFYTVASELTLLATSFYKQLISFGTCLGDSPICLVPQTGEVVWVSFVPSGLTSLVNSSLEQFIAAASAVYERFPFDSWTKENGMDMFHDFDRLQAEWEAAANELTVTVNAIDPAIHDIDGFWRTFFDDINIGDYATKDILEGC